ncbi:MAG TPA: aldehyde ferredoxin oxidoreductase N-terminal domain-containing protein [Dehalococcoidales bacterium]|nr:aldehyde ferredoxin oxidoreductase N-terminal domain-containing protein [Dehalococcoidales bacterium]
MPGDNFLKGVVMAGPGYAGEILKIDLAARQVSQLPTAAYADRFIGGKGLAAALYWDNVPPPVKAFDPENCLICASGPVAGFPGFAASRWFVAGKTAAAAPETFSYGNLGGSWGNRLKYAGYDGLVVRGKADGPVYIHIHDGAVEFKDASHLWGKSAFEAMYALKDELGPAASVLTIGPAAENLVAFATVLADMGSSGSGGVGSIMGSKNLKAVVVAGNKKPSAADPTALREAAGRVRQLRTPPPQVWWMIPGRTRQQVCHACGIGCFRHQYTGEDGRIYKSFCQPFDVYRRPAGKYYDGWNEVVLQATRLCDGYGLDSSVMQAMIEWLIRCYKEGVLGEKDTGLPLAKIGSPEFIEALTGMIARREGFGDVLARGTVIAAEALGGRAAELISYSVMNRTNEIKDYDPRLILHNALLLATEPRRAMQTLHEPSGALIAWLDWLDGVEGAQLTTDVMRRIAERYWGGAAAADYSGYQGKALAARKIQDRTYALESLVLCNARWPMLHSPLTDDRLGDPSLYQRIFMAVTGREVDGAELYRLGERIFNLQRAILLREGWRGREGDRLLDYHHEEPLRYVRFNRQLRVPGKDGEVASREGQVVDRDEFEKMKSEYYGLRGWDVESGLPTRAKLEELQLRDIADDLDERGLLGGRK